MKPTLVAALSAALLAAACGEPAAPPVTPPPPAVTAAPPLRPAPRAPVSGIDKANFDPAVRPQDDFFRAVNGGWLARTEIPEDKPIYGAGAKTYDETQLRLRVIVETAAGATASPPGSEAQKIGDLFSSFMDEAKADALGQTPIDGELARIDALKSKADIPALLAHYNLIGVTSPIASSVHQDNKDATRYIIDFGQSGLGLPERDYYVNTDKKFVQLRAAYAAYASKNLALIGIKDADGGGQTLLALETRLAKSHSLAGQPAPAIDGLSGEQRVLMGYAQVWAQKARDEARINQLKSDPHAPGEFRVNGVVVNVPEFYSAFGVKQGDAMWKPESARITIW